MGMSIDRTLAYQRKLKEGIRNLVDNTIRFEWTLDEFLAYRKCHIYGDPTWRKLPRWSQEYLLGYQDGLMVNIDRLTVFSYVIDEKGTRAAIDSDLYRKVAPSVIHKLYSHTGAHVWRSNVNKFWSPDLNSWHNGEYTCQRCHTMIGKNLLGEEPHKLVYEHIAQCRGLSKVG